MEPLTATAVAKATVETMAMMQAAGAETTLGMEVGLESAAEIPEALLGEQGLVLQLDTIRFGSLDALAVRNETALNMRNSELAGGRHPETGVPFEKDVVVLPNGKVLEGVFPEFNAAYETRLPNELLMASDYRQSQYCNEQLRQAIEGDPGLKANFSEIQVQQIVEGETPDGYTWHHHQEPGRMQLVDSAVHLKTGHTGGKEIWGGGR